MSPTYVTRKEREDLVDEGRQAALRKDDPITCPYLSDRSDERFVAWMKGFREAQQQVIQE